jgi:hypothetical protein
MLVETSFMPFVLGPFVWAGDTYPLDPAKQSKIVPRLPEYRAF